MAIQQVVISDISGVPVGEEDHARVIVEHPDFPVALELDTSTEEAEKFQSTALRLVTVTIHAPNVPVRQVVVETRILDKLFDKLDFNGVLEGARKADTPAMPVRRGRPPKSAGASAPKGDRIDYGDPKFAGNLHRGKVTEAEAAYVRDNLEAVNKRLKAEGGRVIDPKDASEKKRYGF